MHPHEPVILRLGRFTCHRSRKTYFVLIVEERRPLYRYAKCPECHVEHQWEFVTNKSDLPLQQEEFICKSCKTTNRIYFVQKGHFYSRCSDCETYTEVEG